MSVILRIRTHASKQVLLRVLPTDIVATIKSRILEDEGLLANTYRLCIYMNNNVIDLNDSHTIDEYPITNSELKLLPCCPIVINVKNQFNKVLIFDSNLNELAIELKERLESKAGDPKDMMRLILPPLGQ